MLVRFQELFPYIQAFADRECIDEIRKHMPWDKRFLEEMHAVLNMYADFLEPFKTLTDLCQSAT